MKKTANAILLGLCILIYTLSYGKERDAERHKYDCYMQEKIIGTGNGIIHIIPALSSDVCKNGDKLKLTAVVKSEFMIVSVEANIGGLETVLLKPTHGNKEKGNTFGNIGSYEAEWIGHGLIEKVYDVKIKVTDILGNSIEDSSLQFSDQIAGNSVICLFCDDDHSCKDRKSSAWRRNITSHAYWSIGTNRRRLSWLT